MQALLLVRVIKVSGYIFGICAPDRIQRSNGSQLDQMVAAQLGHPMGEVGNRVERPLLARANDRSPRFFAQPAGITKAHA